MSANHTPLAVASRMFLALGLDGARRRCTYLRDLSSPGTFSFASHNAVLKELSYFDGPSGVDIICASMVKGARS